MEEEGSDKKSFIEATVRDRPTLKDLKNHVILAVSVRWKDLGIQLLDSELYPVLDIIEMDHPKSAADCCTCMLSKWLDTQPGASWSQLLEGIKAVGLYYWADFITKKLKGKKALIGPNNHELNSDMLKSQQVHFALRPKLTLVGTTLAAVGVCLMFCGWCLNLLTMFVFGLGIFLLGYTIIITTFFVKRRVTIECL